MAWVEVYGGQRSLAFELTIAILWVEIHNKWALVPRTIMSAVILCETVILHCYLWELTKIRIRHSIVWKK